MMQGKRRLAPMRVNPQMRGIVPGRGMGFKVRSPYDLKQAF
jgi:hypothetical protein